MYLLPANRILLHQSEPTYHKALYQFFNRESNGVVITATLYAGKWSIALQH